MRICDVDDCNRKHLARGFCGGHYRDWWEAKNGRVSRESEFVDRACIVCETVWRTRRADAKYCSQLCYHFDRWGARSSPWPKSERKAKPPKPMVVPFQAERECAWCGIRFGTSRKAQIYCSRAHKIKAIKNRRRGREYGSTSHFTWAEVMRLFVGKFDRCCAYCETPIVGQPDPDHVVPLSRGGSNGITNILPSCRPCNSDKRDLFLHEWAADRARRELPTRVTSWSMDDARYHHLTDALLISRAA